jgi:hypothetical protein
MRYLAPILTLCCAVALGAAAQQKQPKRNTKPVRPGQRKPPPPPSAPSGTVYTGSVVEVNSTQSTLVVSGRTANERPQVIQVSPEADVVRHVRGTAADLKVGELIEVVGVPLEIDARNIRVGEVRPSAAVHRDPSPAKPGASRPASSLPVVQPQLLGKVVRVSPLAIELGGGVTASVKVGSDTTITRIVRIPLNDLKPGEPVMAMGSRNTAGVLVARRIQAGFNALPGADRRTASRPRKK